MSKYESDYQLGEAIYQRVMENPETFFSEYNLAKLPHKDYQIFDPELPEVCLLNDQTFLQATAHLDDATYAVELYRVYLRRSLSEAEKQGCINWLQTPGHSRELGLQAWRTQTFPEFQKLLESSMLSVGLEQAVACYRRVIKLSPSHYQSYYRLADILIQQGKSQAAIAVYHQLSLRLAEVGRLDEAVACFQKVPQITAINRQEFYEYLWKGFNQLGTIDPQYSYDKSELQSSEIEQYFVRTSKYTMMDIWNISDTEQAFLEKANICLANIELIAQDNLALEEIYINNFVEGNQQRELAKKYPKTEYSQFLHHPHLNQINAYQQSIAETGYIYSICAVSGKIIRSNQSFYDVGWLPIISYRFVGYETYYLTVGHFWGPKIFIYFPRLELIIHLSRLQGEWQAKDVINRLKANMVSSWKKTLNYISTPSKKVTAILGTIPNIGHYFWNEVTGIYYLYENDILPHLDLILIEPNEYFNVGDIFPEVADKIRRIADKKSVFQTILGENYCALRATNVFVKEKLAVRVYEGSVKRCSQSVLEEVEQARKKHFPLLWFGIRTHNKSWVSQVEGIVNIMKSLATDFPNVGVVIDGWSRIETEDAYGESMIAKDQATLKKILDIIPSRIGIYSTIGSMMYEKVVWAYAIDLYVIPLSSGNTVVSWIANKPGVMHANSTINQGFREQVSKPRENSVPPVFIAVEDIIDIADPQVSPYNLSYDLDWKVIYNEVIKIISGLELQKWDEVAVALSQAVTLHSNVGNYSAVGQCWEKLGELEKAIATYRQAIKLNPDPEEINFGLAETLQQQAKLYLEKAALAYRRAIELNPEQIESYQKLLEIEPENGDSWFSLGKVLEKKGDVDSAVKAYGRACELNPEDAEIHQQLGELLVKLDRLEEALVAYRKAIELNPDFSESHNKLGDALAKVGRIDEASVCYRRALEFKGKVS